MGIEKAAETMKEFLERNIGSSAKMITIEKKENGWTGIAEVFEESSFIKSLGLSTKVMDRNYYEIKLTADFEVAAYKQKMDFSEEEE
ncbi:MAG: gas vesicle protein [Bacteroidetes bacterium]|nr:gas vesicle protein [Bacteroidota bacterium]